MVALEPARLVNHHAAAVGVHPPAVAAAVLVADSLEVVAVLVAVAAAEVGDPVLNKEVRPRYLFKPHQQYL